MSLFWLLAMASLRAGIKSKEDTLGFDLHGDGVQEMSLSANGLYIGDGQAEHGLHIGGSIGLRPYIYNSDGSIEDSASLVLVNTQSDNVVLTLPSPAAEGRLMEVFKMSGNNTLTLMSEGNMTVAGDPDSHPDFMQMLSGDGGSVRLLSYDLSWQVLDASSSTLHGSINQGLLAWYPLDEISGVTATDEMGLYPGTTQQSDFSVASISGYHGQAFQAAGNSISLGDWNPGTTFSISAWVKWDGSAGVQIICAKRNQWGDMMYQFGINGSLSVHSNEGGLYAFGLTPKVDEWSHVVLVVENGITGTLYVDGVSSSMGLTLGSGTTANIVIGAAQIDDMGETFSGAIDDVRIYSRALNAGEVSYLFSN
jgi:hypothetical protein